MKHEIIFEEKQKLGFNGFNLLFRLALALFCFISYYFTERREVNGDLLFFIGIAIMIITILMFFVTHLHTVIYNSTLELNGLWTTRKVKVDLANIISAEILDYSSYHLNRPAYNLHFKGTIRFYTSGTKAVKITDKDGLNYLIGTQRPIDLHNAISRVIKK